MQNNVYINYSTSGLGTPATGEDFISGLMFYGINVYPSGFSNTGNTKEILSVSQANSLGITGNHIGEVRATGSTTILTAANIGDTITPAVITQTTTVSFGTYTVTTATAAATATGVVSMINAGSLTHGFTATASTATILVTAPAGTGIGANNYTFNNSSTTGITYSSTTFANGTASKIDFMNYHISEYFRANPTGDLWVMINTGSSSSSYAEIVTLQNTTNGKLRQLGIFENTAFSVNNCNAIQGQINTNVTNNKPLEVIYQPDFVSVTDLTNLVDLQTANAQNVTVCLAQDGANVGYGIWNANNRTKTVGSVGLTLGSVSKSLVSNSIAWVEQNNVDNVEMDTIAFANGQFYNDLNDNLITNIDSKQYTFLKKYVGAAGSYYNNDSTAIVITSDYSNVHNNRTIHKAARQVRSAMIPSIASPVYFNADGTIALVSIAHFKNVCSGALAQMVSSSEISQYAVIINAAQNVLSTKTLNITIQIVPVGVANIININLGFVLSV